jgi:hypothetical protein
VGRELLAGGVTVVTERELRQMVTVEMQPSATLRQAIEKRNAKARRERVDDCV